MPPRRSSTAGMSKVLLPIGISGKPSVEKYCHRRSTAPSVGRSRSGPGRPISARAGWGTTGWAMCPAPSPTMPITSTSTTPTSAGSGARALRVSHARTRRSEQLRAGAREQREEERAPS